MAARKREGKTYIAPELRGKEAGEMQNIVIDCFKDGKKIAEIYLAEFSHEELERVLNLQEIQGRT